MSGLISPYKGLYRREWFLVSLILLNAAGVWSRLYKGLYTDALEEANEIVPKRVSHKGEHLSNDLTLFHDEVTKKIHFNVSVGNEEHLIVLQPSTNFFIPTLQIERRRRREYMRVEPKFESKNCHFQGVIDGQKDSRVAISACNGLTGVIISKDGKYYIEPAHHEIKKVAPGHKHLVYKRSAVVTSYPKRKRRKKRKKPTNCGTRVPKKWTLLEWQNSQGKVKVQKKKSKQKDVVEIPNIHKGNMKKLKYRRQQSRAQRSISRDHYVETLVVADASMVEFHQDGEIETYILTLMNMVSMLYQDPSLGNSVHVVVVKIILIEDPLSEPLLNVTTNADLTLKTFCKWQLPNHNSKGHDAAILITRKDICARQDEPCGTLGVAHIGGMCKASRSCSVNEDNGITSAHTIAHELGHNFGMIHDTEKIGCRKKDGNTVHIMTPNFEADSVNVDWSNCSRREITRFLDKGLGKCLQNHPQDLDVYKYPDLPPGVMYDANYQCRLQFGANATLCSPPEEICLHLWCTVNNSCTTLLRPSAHGTYCGKHMWCQKRRCVPMLEPPLPTDGGWGEWGPWSACSRSCGSGVSAQTRRCDHPTPTAGGRFCVGERERYRICNAQACPAGRPTFRATQCSAHDGEVYEGRRYKWQPYFDQGDPCQLYCSDANETVIVPWGDYAKDGTPCSVVSRDVCISGICKKVGCDMVVDSTTEEDDCGICQGDGSKCETREGTYEKQNWEPGYREIAVMPRGARNIRIDENDYSQNYISIGSALARKFYLNGDRHISLPGEYTVAGTQALYGRDNHLEKIRIPGPILEPIVVYIYYRGKTFNPGVHYRYSIWKQQKTKQVKYTWHLSEWSQCSATCGGGVQSRGPLCRESTMDASDAEMERPTSVDDYFCEPADKPEREMRACNDDVCPYKWWVGPWQACSGTCAIKGKSVFRRRSVVCVDGQEMALQDNFCDKKAKPLEYEPCTFVPICEDD
ncbi:unnamed protein product [Phaedon cochleariae]|uniref:Peptidase M12B domain-containing protein n=1 Tax=Phaedon cochleariae TaxID=80249 RepID=A0A9P0DIM0_PHACE|nr:unnamed protein product [Phaedon cochleariae]